MKGLLCPQQLGHTRCSTLISYKSGEKSSLNFFFYRFNKINILGQHS